MGEECIRAGAVAVLQKDDDPRTMYGDLKQVIVREVLRSARPSLWSVPWRSPWGERRRSPLPSPEPPFLEPAGQERHGRSASWVAGSTGNDAFRRATDPVSVARGSCSRQRRKTPEKDLDRGADACSVRTYSFPLRGVPRWSILLRPGNVPIGWCRGECMPAHGFSCFRKEGCMYLSGTSTSLNCFKQPTRRSNHRHSSVRMLLTPF